MPKIQNPVPGSISRPAPWFASWWSACAHSCRNPLPIGLWHRPGFFLAAYDFITNRDIYKLDKAQKTFLKHETFYGSEIVANTRRMRSARKAQ